jgi:hypothetical protein
MIGENKWDSYGEELSILGDLNGDCYAEVAVFTPNYPDYNNPIVKIYIYSYKKFTVVKDYKGNIPNNFILSQNFPNPFNPATTISYSIPQMGFVTIKVFDVLGNEIATLVNEQKAVGDYKINFNANKYASGVYFYQLKTHNIVLTKKMVLLR